MRLAKWGERLRSDRVLRGQGFPAMGCEIGAFQSMPNRSSYYRHRGCNRDGPIKRRGIELFLIFWMALAPLANGFASCPDHRNDQVTPFFSGHRSHSTQPKSHSDSENPNPNHKKLGGCNLSGCGFHTCGSYVLCNSEWKARSARNRAYFSPNQPVIQNQTWLPELRPPA